MQRPIGIGLALVSFFAGLARAGNKEVGPVTFEKHVRPIFKAMCYDCHGDGEQRKGKLDLRLRRFIATGGDSGPAVVPGKPEESLLIERVEAGEMPPGEKKLSKDEIAILRRWVETGANTVRPEPEKITDESQFTEEERGFWAFQPIHRPDVPPVKSADRVRTPIDAFLLAKLEEKGLTFAPEADKVMLLRRASFDLTGLAPSPEETAKFLADASADAYERLIDRLLDSPHYGERWGRHWLDVAGYADSDGYTPEDPVRKYAWKYRDYVIRAFNADKPWDQFIQEQLAGDEMVPPPHANLSPEAIEKLVATGFLRMAPDGTGTGGVDQNVARNQVVAETIKVVTSSLLGMTVGCAQCHNHRYDPIPQADYYRMRAIFEPALDWKNWRPPQARLISLYTDADRTKAADVEAEAKKIDEERTKKQEEYIQQTFEKQVEKLPEEMREAARTARKTPDKERTEEQKKLLKENPNLNVSAGSLYLYDNKAANELKKMAEDAGKVRATKPVEDFISVLTEPPGHSPATFLFHRGDYEQPKQSLPPGELTVVSAVTGAQLAADDPQLPTTGRRLAYARQLTDGKHPLVPRVLVNRFWLHHFGRGIVNTPADFGYLGERPTHPELLDWLASEFVSPGPQPANEKPWSLKRLHRLIMLSMAYRQSSARDAAKEQIDSDNKLLGRMTVRRLEAEIVRDAILAASGKLNPKQFGAPVPVMEDEVGQVVVGIENLNGENRPDKTIPLNGEEFRRSVYVQVRRSRPLGVMEPFDLPALEPNCESRNASTVATQSLLLMNNEFVLEEAEHMAERLRKEAGDEARAQAKLAWRIAFAAEPTEKQLTDTVAFLGQQTEHFVRHAPPPANGKAPANPPDPKLQALANFCQALLTANRFLYID